LGLVLQVRERTFDLFGAGEGVPRGLKSIKSANAATVPVLCFFDEREAFVCKLVFMEFLAEISPSSKGQMGRVILN
jgi:hypothetical protein